MSHGAPAPHSVGFGFKVVAIRRVGLVPKVPCRADRLGGRQKDEAGTAEGALIIPVVKARALRVGEIGRGLQCVSRR